MSLSITMTNTMMKVNRKLQLPNPGKTTNNPDSSGMKIWVMPLGKEPHQLRFLLKAKGTQNR